MFFVILLVLISDQRLHVPVILTLSAEALAKSGSEESLNSTFHELLNHNVKLYVIYGVNRDSFSVLLQNPAKASLLRRWKAI